MRPKTSTIIIVTLLALFVAREAYLYSVIHHPHLLKYMSKSSRRHMQHFYGDHIKSVIQYTPGCGRYDAELAYTLEPGRFIFSDMEFTNRYEVNSAGVRDDEGSLRHPEVIVLGDSHAMGWGVEQDETFPQLIEKKLNL
jgi:hypothetical protein